jgi:hypothetical protein
MEILAAPFREAAHRDLGRFHQRGSTTVRPLRTTFRISPLG